MKIKRIEHVAIAVQDIAAVTAIFEDKFGLTVEYTDEINRNKLAMFPVGESYVELLQGMTPETRTAQWISKKGPGLYHICFEVDDIDGALAELKGKGVKLLTETPIAGHANSRIAFIDPSCTGDVLIELAELPAAGHAAQPAA